MLGRFDNILPPTIFRYPFPRFSDSRIVVSSENPCHLSYILPSMGDLLNFARIHFTRKPQIMLAHTLLGGWRSQNLDSMATGHGDTHIRLSSGTKIPTMIPLGEKLTPAGPLEASCSRCDGYCGKSLSIHRPAECKSLANLKRANDDLLTRTQDSEPCLIFPANMIGKNVA
ncbi:MAG: hypothetical protein IPG22_22870 [Acidobacteria bacterium]|nr:hypothetical protein [Acidobacteriota bacterium]